MSAARQTPMTTPPTTTVVRKPARARENRMGSPQDGIRDAESEGGGARIRGCSRPHGSLAPVSHPVDSLSTTMTSDPRSRLVLTGHGRAAREALWEQIAAARGGDPLAPITVAVPTTYAGLSLRRDLGRRPGGLVNVRFLSLNRVAELLGAPFLAAPPDAAGRVPLTATHRAGAIRVALDATDGPFRPLASHPATTRAFAATVAELDGLTDAELERVASAGPREASVVDVARRVRTL